MHLPTLPPEVKLIISDVDETIADNYRAATTAMIKSIENLLLNGISMFLVSGQSMNNIHDRIVKQIDPKMRKNILIGHCNGSEVWGYGLDGNPLAAPFFSRPSEVLRDADHEQMRSICGRAVESFRLCLFQSMPSHDFRVLAQGHPHAVMHDDRGVQLTFEFPFASSDEPGFGATVDSVKATPALPEDLRTAFARHLNAQFAVAGLSVSAHKTGSCAVDIFVNNVTKRTAVQFVMGSDAALAHLGLSQIELSSPWSIEVWGDRFSEVRDGADRHMLEALNPQVRAIDFRPEPLHELPVGRNIIQWDGQSSLHEGLLEYLCNSHLAT